MDQLRAELTVARRPAGLRAGWRHAAVLILMVAGVGACGAPAPAEPYVGLLPTKEAAAQAVADALSARDVDRLVSLAVSDLEFRKNIWPALPASQPDVGMPADYVWSDTNLRSRGQLAETLNEHGGEPLTVDAVRFGGDSTDYEGFRLHREAWVSVHDRGGHRQELRLFGSMVETTAGWKVYSYIVD